MRYAVSNGAYSRGLPREVETSGQAIGWVWGNLRRGELVSPNVAGVPFALLHDRVKEWHPTEHLQGKPAREGWVLWYSRDNRE